MSPRPPIRQSDEERGVSEETPLIRTSSQDSNGGGNETPERSHGLAAVCQRLYLSHFLSTWNSRVFEFGAVLYLATIYPGTLLPMSVYAFARGLSAIIFAPAAGLYIDTGNRMQVVRVSIVGQRVVVAASCMVFYLLSRQPALDDGGKIGFLALVSFLACIEKLCSILNLVSVEKDWVVVVANGDQELLSRLNSQMRRIDLFCKLLGPLFIALIDGYSTQLAILVNLGMNIASVVVEYFAIAQVYYGVPELQERKKGSRRSSAANSQDASATDCGRISRIASNIGAVFQRTVVDFKQYFNHRAFLPSFSGALLYFTVLSFSGQMVTYLLDAGYDSTQIGVARTLSVVFEMLATWVAPWLIGKIGPVRAGLWLVNNQVTMLVAGTALFWTYDRNPLASATGLVGGTILSRLGLRGFDLCAQIIVQNEVEAEIRGAFSSVEAGWQNAFELLSFASTMIFYRPDQFKWPALVSVSAVGLSSAIYASYVYVQRKHLLHLDAVCGWACQSWRWKKSEAVSEDAPNTSSQDNLASAL